MWIKTASKLEKLNVINNGEEKLKEFILNLFENETDYELI